MSYLWNFSSGNIILDQFLPVLFLHVELSNFFVKQNNLYQAENLSRLPVKEVGLIHTERMRKRRFLSDTLWIILKSAILIELW